MNDEKNIFEETQVNSMQNTSNESTIVESPQPHKKNKVSIIIIVLLLLIIFGLVGYIYYDKYVTKEESKTAKNIDTTKETDIKNTTGSKETIINDNDEVRLLNSEEYVEDKIVKKEGIYDIELPKLKGNTNGIISINDKINKIYNELLSVTDVESVNSSYALNKSNYKGINILDIIINTNRGSKELGGDSYKYCYHYNIDTGKEYTLSDVVKNENYSLEDMDKKLNEYLNEVANGFGGERMVKGREHKFVSDTDMYYVMKGYNDENNYIHLVLDKKEGYTIQNEKNYYVDFEYNKIDYKIMESYKSLNY